MNGDRPVYNVQKRAKAGTTATFRAAASIYIAYLGYTILRNYLRGESAVPPWASWLAGIGFIAAALAFGFYTLKRYRADLAAAAVPASEPEEEEDGS